VTVLQALKRAIESGEESINRELEDVLEAIAQGLSE